MRSLERALEVAEMYGTCDEEVSRRGEAQPCDKTAVAMKADPEGPYPVCAYHSHGDMVALSRILLERP